MDAIFGTRSAEDAKRAANAPWNEADVRTFLTAIRHDRLYAAMMLALIANRPAEVCGARWQDIDLDGKGTIVIGNTRTIVYDRSHERGERNKVVETCTKTESGNRLTPEDLRAWENAVLLAAQTLAQAAFPVAE